MAEGTNWWCAEIMILEPNLILKTNWYFGVTTHSPSKWLGQCPLMGICRMSIHVPLHVTLHVTSLHVTWCDTTETCLIETGDWIVFETSIAQLQATSVKQLNHFNPQLWSFAKQPLISLIYQLLMPWNQNQNIFQINITRAISKWLWVSIHQSQKFAGN